VQNFVSSGIDTNTGNGVLIDPFLGTIKFAVTNTIASNNGFAGIYYNSDVPTNGVIDHVTTLYNGTAGIFVSTTNNSAPLVVAITNSVASNNGGSGLSIATGPNGTVSIDNLFATGSSDGIAAGGNGVILLNHSVIQGNTDGIVNDTPNTFFTYGNNAIDFNSGSNISVPLNTVTKLR